MYIVTIHNGDISTEIHNEHHKLFSGNVVQGINTIDSFTFSVFPGNPAFGTLRDFTTLVSVYNTARQRYEFQGRVLYSAPQMSDKGLLTQETICESYLGFLCDSQQEYVAEGSWQIEALLRHILDCHNSQLEGYKHFRLGEIEGVETFDAVYVGIQRENTWKTIKEKVLDNLELELRVRQSDGVLYLDFVKKLGETKSTEIALSKNMKSIIKEKNPSTFITRLIPLGAKIEDTEDRVDITSVNAGKNYIDDAEAIAEYGLHVGYVEFDDITLPENLLFRGSVWLRVNNKVNIKYSITALDLSLLGLDADDFDVGNTYPIKNALLGIDDRARINKKTIDVCDETKTSIEIGESFKKLSELQREQYATLGKVNADVAVFRQDFSVYKATTAAQLALKVNNDDNDKIVSMLNASAEVVTLNANRLTISSDYFKLSADGKVEASEVNLTGKITAQEASKIGGWTIGNGALVSENIYVGDDADTGEKIYERVTLASGHFKWRQFDEGGSTRYEHTIPWEKIARLTNAYTGNNTTLSVMGANGKPLQIAITYGLVTGWREVEEA